MDTGGLTDLKGKVTKKKCSKDLKVLKPYDHGIPQLKIL